MRNKIGTYVFHLVAAILVVVTLYPVFFVYANALKPNAEISQSFMSLPLKPFLGGFKYIIVDKQAYIFLLNSLLVVVGATAIGLLVTVLASYRIARHRMKLGNVIYIFLLLGIILSHHSSIVPIFIILRGIGLLNRYLGLMLVFAAWNISLAMLILTEFFRFDSRGAPAGGHSRWSLQPRVHCAYPASALASAPSHGNTPWGRFRLERPDVPHDAYQLPA